MCSLKVDFNRDWFRSGSLVQIVIEAVHFGDIAIECATCRLADNEGWIDL